MPIEVVDPYGVTADPQLATLPLALDPTVVRREFKRKLPLLAGPDAFVRPQAIRVAELPDALAGGDEGVVEGVLGLVAVVEDRGAVVVEAVGVAVIDVSPRAGVTPLDPAGQRRVVHRRSIGRGVIHGSPQARLGDPEVEGPFDERPQVFVGHAHFLGARRASAIVARRRGSVRAYRYSGLASAARR